MLFFMRNHTFVLSLFDLLRTLPPSYSKIILEAVNFLVRDDIPLDASSIEKEQEELIEELSIAGPVASKLSGRG